MLQYGTTRVCCVVARNISLNFEEPQLMEFCHMKTTKTYTKKQRVINHLARGNDLTPKQAFSRFGVANLRATISDIKSQVEAYGNWVVSSRTLDNGVTCYEMGYTGHTNPFAARAGL